MKVFQNHKRLLPGLGGAMPLILPRGLRGIPRADASTADLVKMLADVNKNFEALKAANDENLKKRDVVLDEKIEKINSKIGDDMIKVNTALDEIAKKMAALQLGGGGGGKETDPDKIAYSNAFNRYFRKGEGAEALQGLAVKASMKSDSDPDGGYTVTPEMERTIDRVLSTVSAMRSLATVRNISSGSYKKLVNQGGTTGGWVGEREARPETNTSTLSGLEFPAMELYANPFATQTLLDDSFVNIEEWIADEVSIVFAEMEGAAFVSGNGVNKPRGILGYTPVANASYAWGNPGYIATGVAAAIFDGSNNGVDRLLDLVYSLKQGYRNNARFMMNRTTQGAVRKLKNATTGDYLWAPPQVNGTQLGQPATLAGYGITDDDNMPDIAANAFPIAFGDFRRGYLIVDRVGVRVLRDPYTNKPYVGFYTTKRVGGGIQNFEAIKLYKVATS